MNRLKVLSTFAILAIAFASCKKDYTCKCTLKDSTGAVVSSSSTTFKATKSQATKSCDGLVVSSGGNTMTCDIE